MYRNCSSGADPSCAQEKTLEWKLINTKACRQLVWQSAFTTPSTPAHLSRWFGMAMVMVTLTSYSFWQRGEGRFWECGGVSGVIPHVNTMLRRLTVIQSGGRVRVGKTVRALGREVWGETEKVLFSRVAQKKLLLTSLSPPALISTAQ